MSGRNPAQFRSIVTEVLWGSVTASIASVAANTVSVAQTISVPGASLGDFVEISASLSMTGGLVLSAEVSAADVVTVRVANVTVGAVVPPATCTYQAVVYKRQAVLLT